MIETETTLVEKMAQLLCDPESTRFSKPYHDGTGLYVTDGRLLLSFGDIEPPEGMPCNVKVDGKWQIEEPHRKPPERSEELLLRVVTGILSVPAVDGPPEGCNHLWETMQECGPCGGLGYQECDLGHEHDCVDCRGTGQFLQSCDEAGEGVEILGEEFARRYVWVIGKLPGMKLCPQLYEHMLGFTFDGGKGGLMAIMKDRK